MKTITRFLKAVVWMLSLPVIALCIFVVPQMGIAAAMWAPAFPIIQYTTWLALYASSVVYFVALYKAYTLLTYIERARAFSLHSMQALNTIKRCGVAICSLHLLVLPVFYLFAEIDDAPGVIFVGFIVPIASFVIAMFALLLKRLVNEALTKQLSLT